MFECIERSREDLDPWMPWARADNRSVAECVYQIERFRRMREVEPFGEATEYQITIFERTSGALLGGTGLHRIEPVTLQAETGYWIDSTRRGEGLATEAIAWLIDAALTPKAEAGWGLRRINIFCSGANDRSAAVPRRLGIRQECARRHERWTDGIGWTGTLGFGVCADEWDHQAKRVAGA